MNCPEKTCDFECASFTEMAEHILIHDLTVTKRDYTYEAEFYQNSKGKAQVICKAKGDDLEHTASLVILLWNEVRKQAQSQGIEVMEN